MKFADCTTRREAPWFTDPCALAAAGLGLNVASILGIAFGLVTHENLGGAMPLIAGVITFACALIGVPAKKRRRVGMLNLWWISTITAWLGWALCLAFIAIGRLGAFAWTQQPYWGAVG